MERSITSTVRSSPRLEHELLDYDGIQKLEDELGSSFYVLDVNKLKENYRKIDEAFRSRYKNLIIGYSYKTNYLPHLCKELSRLGAYAEVVSRLEYDLALKIGEDPTRIIFNGPLKNIDDIYFALSNKSILNIDSLYEIDFVKSFAARNPEIEVPIGLRVNFDISQNGVSELQEGYKYSRFGICVDNGNLEYALSELREQENIRIIGLHGHFSTKDRSIESYKIITQNLCKLAKENILDSLEYIDIGGGIYGELPKPYDLFVPTFDDYAETICGIMNKEFKDVDKKPFLILEPGVAMVANVFLFIAKVIESKKIRNDYFVLVDGSVHNVKPTLHKNNLPMRIIRRKHDCSRGKKTFNIVGYTCMEKDYLASEIKDRLPMEDDYIIFENVGAYTIVFNPPFIKERPGIVAMDNRKVVVARKKETIRQFFNEEIYVF
ncbi:type III PLP-dependent enzyme domain-containing protein [Bacillus norwichensis]|uniref:Diaminopimelate decarboxylase n=1 Tax=Bacillus norwichensis TaxID=2762217 RepID=A0ABR8VJ05_9BACI|nr:diaminopimelate decarboxylase [Bacillus norwichensis]MBD8004755.1 diaminopimelate decarboxylase [Bacillus norwichensis]